MSSIWYFRIATLWRHQMETFSPLLAFCAGNSPVTGEFHAQRPMTRSFDVFFDLRLNKRLSKQSWGRWFETPSRSSWRHCSAPSLLSIHFEMCHKIPHSFRFTTAMLCSFFKYLSDVMMSAMASQITGVSIVYSNIRSGANKKNSKAPRHWPLWGDSPVTGELPAWRASNSENVSIWWRHHHTSKPG